jgi:regulator of sigma E protease
MFNLYEAIFKKEISAEIMIKLTIAGWVILGSLMIVGIFNDLHRLIGG